VDTLDTAVTYGESESCLGAIGVGNFHIVTKLPEVPKSCEDPTAWALRELQASLARLGVDHVHGLLLHRPAQLLGPDGAKLYRALTALKDGGQVRKVGISIYSPDELEAITRLFRIDLIQAPFNLVDRRIETTGWLRRLKDDGVEVHTRSAFLQGLLLMPQEARPKKFLPWAGLWTRWHDWLTQNGESAVRSCLSFALSHREVDRVLVGADSTAQLAQIIEAAREPLSTLPNLRCDDENLVNPSRWSQL